MLQRRPYILVYLQRSSVFRCSVINNSELVVDLSLLLVVHKHCSAKRSSRRINMKLLHVNIGIRFPRSSQFTQTVLVLLGCICNSRQCKNKQCKQSKKYNEIYYKKIQMQALVQYAKL